MARRTPSRIQVTCSTTGFGPYTLVDGVPGVGYRTIAQAVLDGSLVNGDEILYCMVDTLAAGTGKMLEVGRGTLNTTTKVLTNTVYERSKALTDGGGWGAGTRDVIISPPTAWNTAFIDFANFFLQNQRISKTDPAWELEQGGVLRARFLYSTNVAYIQYFSSGGIAQGSLSLGNGTLQYSPDGTTYSDVPRISAGFKNVQFPSGGVVKMTFNSAPPVGWTRINTAGERLARFANTGENAGDLGGSWTITGLSTLGGSTDGYTLQVADIPAHTHTVAAEVNILMGTGTSLSLYDQGATQISGSAGGGGSHSHGISALGVQSTGAWRPAYEIVVKASFD